VSVADNVARQLSADYPEDTLGWVKSLTWQEPRQIPLDTVDFTHRASWNASHEPARVAHFAEKITRRAQESRRVKPVVLVDTPATNPGTNLKVIDGHHRSLAYRKLGKPVWGYVAKTDSNKGPWDEFHAQQFPADSRETTDEFAAKSASWLAWESDREQARELAQRLQGALIAAVPVKDIAAEWADIVARQAPGPGAAESYLHARVPQVRAALESALGPAWQQAWELGEQSAQHQLAEGA
jgi:hypothetical protein